MALRNILDKAQAAVRTGIRTCNNTLAEISQGVSSLASGIAGTVTNATETVLNTASSAGSRAADILWTRAFYFKYNVAHKTLGALTFLNYMANASAYNFTHTGMNNTSHTGEHNLTHTGDHNPPSLFTMGKMQVSNAGGLLDQANLGCSGVSPICDEGVSGTCWSFVNVVVAENALYNYTVSLCDWWGINYGRAYFNFDPNKYSSAQCVINNYVEDCQDNLIPDNDVLVSLFGFVPAGILVLCVGYCYVLPKIRECRQNQQRGPAAAVQPQSRSANIELSLGPVVFHPQFQGEAHRGDFKSVDLQDGSVNASGIKLQQSQASGSDSKEILIRISTPRSQLSSASAVAASANSVSGGSAVASSVPACSAPQASADEKGDHKNDNDHVVFHLDQQDAQDDAPPSADEKGDHKNDNDPVVFHLDQQDAQDDAPPSYEVAKDKPTILVIDTTSEDVPPSYDDQSQLPGVLQGNLTPRAQHSFYVNSASNDRNMENENMRPASSVEPQRA